MAVVTGIAQTGSGGNGISHIDLDGSGNSAATCTFCRETKPQRGVGHDDVFSEANSSDIQGSPPGASPQADGKT